jgi:hypothetical protein
MNYLLDTNVISEIRKGRDCDLHVATWYDSIGDEVHQMMLATQNVADVADLGAKVINPFAPMR